MNIAVIDADLIGRKRHKFPNLACMKISGYFKALGANVILKTDYDALENFDKVFIAKVFTDTPIPDGGLFGNILNLPNVTFGGTGFFFDNPPPLPADIEHFKPDYNLYNEWLATVDDGGTTFKAYKDYSIGFLTRGCFRHCPFCVNRKSNKVIKHSPLVEFLDNSRPKICLLDDNFFGYEDWKFALQELINTGKSFTFKQGLDVRLLDEEKAAMLFKAKYDGDFIFAFDDIADAPLIIDKLKLIRSLTKKNVKFYVLCGFDRRGLYDSAFWQGDLINLFRRIEILMKYKVKPFVMKHADYLKSPFSKFYRQVARWANQPFLFWKMSFGEFCFANGYAPPHFDFIDKKFFNMKFERKFDNEKS